MKSKSATRTADATSIVIGQAAVHRVVSELLFRAVPVSLPCVDDRGVDVYAGPVRIQVKAAHLRYNSAYPQGAYWFKLIHGPVVTGNNNIRHRGPRQFSNQCDFVVLMGIDEQRFWVVPAHVLDSVTVVSLALGPQGFYKRSEFAEAKSLRDQGLTQQEIADRLGISQVAVSYQLRGGRKTLPKKTKSGLVREHEGRWELITDALATLREANHIVSDPTAAVTAPDKLPAR